MKYYFSHDVVFIFLCAIDVHTSIQNRCLFCIPDKVAAFSAKSSYDGVLMISDAVISSGITSRSLRIATEQLFFILQTAEKHTKAFHSTKQPATTWHKPYWL
jgi:hypothetical protein